MPKVRKNAARKYVDRASQSTREYEEGVRSPRKSWQESTEAAADNYKSGVQKAITEDRFSKGVAKAGDAKWQAKAISKGAARYPQGVADAEDAYQKGVMPYLNTLEATSLPPRYPKGDPRNLERVKAVNVALRQEKKRQLSTK